MIPVAILILAYILGSIPTGYWIVKALKGIDIRTIGSGSTGTTNVLRTAGKGAAAFVFFVDIAKGYIPVWLAIYAGTNNMIDPIPAEHANWLAVGAAMAALVGHSKSIFLNFQGGKSAATGLGTLMAMSPLAALLAFSTFVTVTAVSKIVSLASMTAVTSSIPFMYFFGGQIPFVIYCAIGAAYVIYRHKANIKRLMEGTEPKIGQKVKIE